MKYIDGDIPIFENDDMSDLNIYSEKMASAIKKRVDKFGSPLIYKGSVDVVENLPQDSEAGWIYNVTNENKNYIFNGTDWIIYSDNFDVSSLATSEDLNKMQTDLKNELAPSKVIKYFGSKTFQNGVANQKVNIQIPLVDNPINFADIRVKIISNYNNADYAGFMEKSISTMITNKQFTNKAEKYTFITNKVADGIAIGGCAIVEDKLMIPISLRTTRGTVIKIIMEGYYYDDNAKNCLENATISNIFTNASVYPKASITTTEITTGEEFATGRIIDGKIEYGKFLKIDNLKAGTVNIPHNISNPKYTRLEGILINKTSGNVQAFPLVDGSVETTIRISRIYSNATNVYVASNFDASIYRAEVTLFYTKS